MHRLVYVIMVVADGLVPNTRQDISNNYADSSVIIKDYHNGMYIVLRNVTTVKQTMAEGGRQPVGFFVTVGVVFSHR